MRPVSKYEYSARIHDLYEYAEEKKIQLHTFVGEGVEECFRVNKGNTISPVMHPNKVWGLRGDEIYLVNIGDPCQLVFPGLEETVIEGKLFRSKLKSHDSKCLKGAKIHPHWQGYH